MKRLVLAAALAATCAAPALAAGAQAGGQTAPGSIPAGVLKPEQNLAPDKRASEPPRPAAQHRFDRNRPETFRSRPEWAGYQGPRAGFWYAPGYGYRPSDPQWAGHVWRRGDHLPIPYRAFYVQTPSFYGLRPPPSGDRWVYFDGDFLLAATATGLVDEVVLNGY